LGTPKTRIPKAVRHDVLLAFECWRDYLAAIGNRGGATMVGDLVEALGLEALTPYLEPSRYRNPGVSYLLKDRRKYGPR
jgi:hypothetical protein